MLGLEQETLWQIVTWTSGEVAFPEFEKSFIFAEPDDEGCTSEVVNWTIADMW